MALVLAIVLPMAACQQESRELDSIQETIIVQAQPVEDIREEETPLPKEPVLPGPRGGFSSRAPASQDGMIESFTATPSSVTAGPAPTLGEDRTAPQPDESGGLESAYQYLVRGEFFHNIPKQFHVSEPVLIEAGVAEEANEELLDILGIEGDITITDGAVYDPLGVELRLETDNPEAFTIQPVSSGRKTVVKADPDTWAWVVTPLKAGDHTLRLKAVVDLDHPERPAQQQELLVTETPVPIQVDIVYSMQAALTQFWPLVVAVGSIVIFGMGGWGAARLRYRHAFTGSDTESLSGQEESS